MERNKKGARNVYKEEEKGYIRAFGKNMSACGERGIYFGMCGAAAKGITIDHNCKRHENNLRINKEKSLIYLSKSRTFSMAHLAGFEPTAFRLGVQRVVFSIVCYDVLQ